MIVYDLECREWQHRFEGWFKSSDDFVQQQERGFVSCPECGSADVIKAVQAPRLARKGNQMPDAPPPSRTSRHEAAEPAAPTTPVPVPARPVGVPTAPVANAPLPPLPEQAERMIQALAKMQAEALKSSRFVGDNFAQDARAMHYGEKDVEAIHGQTTLEEAKELIEEGIEVMPLPFPVISPEKAN